MRKRMLSIICAMSLVSLTVTGCGSDDPIENMSKKQLVAEYKSLEESYNSICDELDGLTSTLQGIQSEDEITPAISRMGDGTDRLTFNSTDSKIIFPVAFQYPGSNVIADNGEIKITDNVSIKPTPNWICKINGISIELENSDSGISGILKVGVTDKTLSAEELKTNVISQWFVKLPPSNITYSIINLGGQEAGVQASTKTYIDSEDAFLKCGMLAGGLGDCITYVFVYRGSEDQSRNESIQTILNTIKVGVADVKTAIK